MYHLLGWKITSRVKIEDHEDGVEKEHYQLADVAYAPGASSMSFGLIFPEFFAYFYVQQFTIRFRAFSNFNWSG
jgi:hypothetical protein